MNANLQAKLIVTPAGEAGEPIPPRIFGNFLEHLGYAVDGGVLAYALANPTFERDTHLNENQVNALLDAGKILTEYFQHGRDPDVIPEHWSPGIGATGFGVCALDEPSPGVPFPWIPIGGAGNVSAAVGQVGGAVRLRGLHRSTAIQAGEAVNYEDFPSGISQGIFLPFQRCLSYSGLFKMRIASNYTPVSGEIISGLIRRNETQHGRAGELLALSTVEIHGAEWQEVPFHLDLHPEQVEVSEPIDFFILWNPDETQDLFIDRAILLPVDAVEGIFDPDVVKEVKDWKVPLLRWPGGNFASYYHWRDGIGPFDRRPTRPNYAWGGLETNFFGTTEFIHFCHLVGAEPQITVNTGTGSPEEAASWVEYCNGSAAAPMGAKRAASRDVEPYQVRLWEVGNEVYGSWQGGYHGSDENAARFCEFAGVMRKADPQIELISTGSQFDIAKPSPRLDHTTADQVWNKKLVEACAGEMDYLSLHCLPGNDLFLEKLDPSQAYYSLVAQPDSWERIFIPQIQALFDSAERSGRAKHPIRLAITEWGVLGSRNEVHPVVENYGEVVYAGIFLNMCIRKRQQVAIANATGLMHGGCIRKAAGQVFHDPQYTVIQKYTELANALALDCRIESPNYDIETAPDLGLPLKDIPYVDAIACLNPGAGKITLCIVNRHLTLPVDIQAAVQGYPNLRFADWEYLSYPDVTARARLNDPARFALKKGSLAQGSLAQGSLAQSTNGFLATLPPCSVSWITLKTSQA